MATRNTDEYVPTAAASSEKYDPFFQDALPPTYGNWRMPGKFLGMTLMNPQQGFGIKRQEHGLLQDYKVLQVPLVLPEHI